MKKSKEIKRLEKKFNCRIIPIRKSSKEFEKYTAWWPEKNCICVHLKRFNAWKKIFKEATIIHELQHQKCCRSHCFCWKRKNDFWVEYHAFKTQVNYLCDNLTKKNRYSIINQLNADLDIYKRLGAWIHFKALKKVLRIKKIREKLELKGEIK